MPQVVDVLGNAVEMKAPPQRIVSCAPYLTDAAMFLGSGPCIAGVCDDSPQPDRGTAYPCIGSSRKPNIAMIRMLQPDLVLACADAIGEDALVDLVKLRVPLFCAHAQNVEESANLVEQLGALLWRKRKASEVRGGIEEWRSYVLGYASREKKKVRVLPLVWKNPMHAAGKATYIGDLLRTCGGESVVQSLKLTPSPSVTWEDIARLDPEVILLPDHPYPFGKTDLNEVFLHAGCRATRDQRVHLVPGRELFWPGPRASAAMKRLFEILRAK